MSLFPFMTTCFVYIIARFFGWKWVKDRYTLNENRIRFRFIIGVVFKLVSKAIRNWTGFALLWSVTGPKNSLHPLDQSDVKLKPFTSWSPTRFLPALWAVIWLTEVFSLLLIGSRYYSGFGFTTLNRKALYKEIYRLACELIISSQFKNARYGNKYLPRFVFLSSAEQISDTFLDYLANLCDFRLLHFEHFSHVCLGGGKSFPSVNMFVAIV